MAPNLESHILAKPNYWSLSNLKTIKIVSTFPFQLNLSKFQKSTVQKNSRMFKIGSKIGNLRIRKLTLLRNTEKTSPSWLSLDWVLRENPIAKLHADPLDAHAIFKLEILV